MEVRDEEMNAMFHLVLSGRVGQAVMGGLQKSMPLLGREGSSNSTHSRHVSPSLQHTLLTNVLSVFLVRVTCGSEHRDADAHTYCSSALSHLHKHTQRVSDGFAIDRATEIIKCCPTGSSIRH